MRSIFLAVVLLFAALAVGFKVANVVTSSDVPARGVPFCGKSLAVDEPEVPRFRSIRVVLAYDEEWRSYFGEEVEFVSRSQLGSAVALFRGMHIQLLPVRLEEWQSPSDARSPAQVLSSVRAAVPLGDADVVVAFTGQKFSGADGRADVGGTHAVVELHDGHPEKDAMVLAHEVAHLFGASHGCDLPGHTGLMAESGFDEPKLVCPCVRGVLERNAERFHDDSSQSTETAID